MRCITYIRRVKSNFTLQILFRAYQILSATLFNDANHWAYAVLWHSRCPLDILLLEIPIDQYLDTNETGSSKTILGLQIFRNRTSSLVLLRFLINIFKYAGMKCWAWAILNHCKAVIYKHTCLECDEFTKIYIYDIYGTVQDILDY